jgi:hypothetical protein
MTPTRNVTPPTSIKATVDAISKTRNVTLYKETN